MMCAFGAVCVDALIPALARSQAVQAPSKQQPRFRVIIDNDFGGDPDGLFALAQFILSPSIEIAAIIGSQLHAGEHWDRSLAEPSAYAAAKAREVLRLAGKPGEAPVIVGAPKALTQKDVKDLSEGVDVARSAATKAIVAEAMRSDPRPLFYAAGAELTDLASAWLVNPGIEERLTLIWIGGPEHQPPKTPTSKGAEPEYNLTLDTLAAQIIFGRSAILIWQAPRDTYRRMLVSFAELREVAVTGPLGAYLVEQVEAVGRLAGGDGMNIGETYMLGDSPLVTLTALQSSFQSDPSSSDYQEIPTPGIADDGEYIPHLKSRPMRVYTNIDTRLTISDLLAKLRCAAR
jgi:inosine-uridine nucleoside N-ribohydrolase